VGVAMDVSNRNNPVNIDELETRLSNIDELENRNNPVSMTV
jgi:hypothetical protein